MRILIIFNNKVKNGRVSLCLFEVHSEERKMNRFEQYLSCCSSQMSYAACKLWHKSVRMCQHTMP